MDIIKWSNNLLTISFSVELYINHHIMCSNFCLASIENMARKMLIKLAIAACVLSFLLIFLFFAERKIAGDVS